MPPPSSEHDLKRLARRRLIGAVALTLLAVIVLPLLLEDEPPPASDLAVRMAAMPELAPATEPPPPKPVSVPEEPLQPVPEPAKPEPVAKAEPPKPAPVKSEPAPPAPKPAPAKPVVKPAAKPAAEPYVVQLAALSDAAKAEALKARAAAVGLPAYTDTLGKLTRVRVGPFATREAAVAAAVKLAENGMTTAQVVTK